MHPLSSPEAMVSEVMLINLLTASLENKMDYLITQFYIALNMHEDGQLQANREGTYSCASSRRAITEPVSTSVARMEWSGEPVKIANIQTINQSFVGQKHQ